MTRHDRFNIGALILTALALTGCESSVTVEMTVEPPQDLDIREVVANLRGVEFQREGGGLETIEFTDAERVELFEYLDGNTLRLLSDEELTEATYSGVRLLFDNEFPDETFVVYRDSDDPNPEDEERDLTIGEDGPYAAIRFSIEEDQDGEGEEHSFTLTLDLRQSMSAFDENEFTMVPHVRAVRTEDAATVQGAVEDRCENEESFVDEAAIYLFAGHNVVPDDRDNNSDVQPYATASVLFDATTEEYFYTAQFLPPGNYTLALACRADLDDPTQDDDLAFVAVRNIDLEDAETLTEDVNN